MKPLLIMPPAPDRWSAVRDLYSHIEAHWLADLEPRLANQVLGCNDVLAVIPSGGQFLAGALVSKRGELGVLAHGFCRPEHRRRGYARALMTALLNWFDVTGGRRLYLVTTAELDEAFYRKFGFEPLHRAVWAPYDRMSMVRRAPDSAPNPYAGVTEEPRVRPLTRADWAPLISMLQYLDGPDPRVPVDESAVSADVVALDLVNHTERGSSALLGAFVGDHLVGAVSVALPHGTDRTYAMLLPHTGAPTPLREAAEKLAHERGFPRLDFPMETLGQ